MQQNETLKLISHLCAVIVKNGLEEQINKEVFNDFFNTTNDLDKELLRLFDMENE